ncbi:MAG: hypothetical protein ABSH48_26190 [Verrucomicrobiota bacterium]|jgi:hypothetical protein
MNKLGFINIGKYGSQSACKKQTRSATDGQKSILCKDVAEHTRGVGEPGKAEKLTHG